MTAQGVAEAVLVGEVVEEVEAVAAELMLCVDVGAGLRVEAKEGVAGSAVTLGVEPVS